MNGSRLGWVLPLTSLALLASGARAETKATFGVGHMCCGKCVAGATAALAKVTSAVAIEGKNVTVTLKEGETNLVPVLDALRKGGFPANKLEAGGQPVTIGVGHLCCGGCKSGLDGALKAAKIESLDADAIKIGEDSVIVKAREGKTLDLIPVLAAIEKGGFGAKSIVVGAQTASTRSLPRRAAAR